MNATEWKTSAQKRLADFATEADRWSAGLLYGGLAASAVFPLVEAAKQAIADGHYEFLPELGSLTAPVMAGKIVGWKDRTIAEIATEMAERAADDPAWRDALDELLLTFDAPRIVEAVLPERDWDRFQRLLQGELAKLGNGDKYADTVFYDQRGQTVEGNQQNISGTVNGYAVAGDVGQIGDIVTGPKTVTHTLVQIYTQATPQANEATAAGYQAALARYVNHLLTTRHLLNLRGIRSFRPVSIELEQAYITLRGLDPRRTEQLFRTHQGKARSRALEEMLEKERETPQPLPHLLKENPRLVVLGDPGSGKTTFLSFLALSAARSIANDNPALLAERLGFDGRVPLPVYVPLREFGRYLRDRSRRERLGPRPQLLLDYLIAYFDGWNLGLPDDFFVYHLETGNCLLLLDGLDEVADFDERVLVSEQVEAFVQRYGARPAGFSETQQVLANRFVITCRVRGYTGQARLGQDFTTATVLPFTQEEIESFVQGWSLAVAASQAQTLEGSVRQVAEQNAADLLRAVGSSSKVRELASNPLLLTVIALVHQYRAKLPERRSELYDECTEVLLGYFEAAKPGDESKRLARYTGTAFEMDAGEKRAFLEPIALAMHHSRRAEWDKEQIIDFLADQFAERGESETHARRSAADFLEALTVRSGLIQEVEQGSYAFLHLSFQEYLAARKLADSADYIAESLAHLDDSWWQEVLLLETGHLSESGRSRASRLVEAILDGPGDAHARLLLAAACLGDVGQLKIEAALWQRVVQALLISITGELPSKARAEAGKALGLLGDPRAGVGVVAALLPDVDWIPISAGPFVMGSDKSVDSLAYNDETPQFTCHLITESYRIARYPVTVAQYDCFAQAEGYVHRKWWTDAGWAWREKQSVTGPAHYREVFQTPNHPVVGVSWYEAVAYCAWLSEQVGYRVELPSEAQWERAVRHTDARIYPWNRDFAPERCNMSQTMIEATSAVGIFPGGKAECGAADMSGNVWEWCRTIWRDNYEGYAKSVSDDLNGDEPRVVRGGSWGYLDDFVRCAYRDRNSPNYRDDHNGFRLLAPGF